MSTLPPPSDNEIVIKPTTAWFVFDWRGLIEYRDLLRQLVLRDFTAKYKQTILGPAWFFLNPLITTLTFTLIFNKVIGVPTDGVPPMLFYLCGMLGWTYFAAVLGATGNSLAGSAALFSKVYFPRLIPPFALAVSCLIALSIQLITFFVFYVREHWVAGNPAVAGPSLVWLAYPAIVLHMAVLALGIGLILSTLTAKYRDLHHIQAFIIQLWMYATPIIYPLSRVPEKWRWVSQLNPMTAIVESTRRLFLGVGHVDTAQYAQSVALSILVFLVGIFAYQRAARTFVDTV
ncbi:MAG TPA: ABC transporter permease [Opitutaceae bacterium]|nr:ABC transporter permease [Opitutaceae bacterium]